MTEFRLPDLGEGLQDAEIVAWHVSEGDHIVADQPLVSVETDKAVVDVPSPWSGTVTALLAKVGDVVAIGGPIAAIDTAGKPVDKGAVVGELQRTEQASEPKPVPEKASSGRVKASPAVRKRAAELGIDLAAVAGTGPGGAVTTKDLEAATAGSPKGWRPLRGVRRSMARNMAKAHAEVAMTTVTEEADITGWAEGEDITLRLVAAMVEACGEVPALNAWYDKDRDAVLLHERIDLGIAVQTEDGLFTPVLRDAGNRSAQDLRAGLDAMRGDIEARSIAAEDLRGQTITLSNFGMMGGRHATLIIVPPQVAILGAGRIVRQPRVVDGTVVPGRALPLSLTFDHRVVTGTEAARFLMRVVSHLGA